MGADSVSVMFVALSSILTLALGWAMRDSPGKRNCTVVLPFFWVLRAESIMVMGLSDVISVRNLSTLGERKNSVTSCSQPTVFPKEEAISKVHSRGLKHGYQNWNITSPRCLSHLSAAQKPDTRAPIKILKEKIQSLHEEAHKMSIRFNQTPVS